MANVTFTLPDLSGVEAGLDDKKERRRIIEYLYQLNEQLRYMLSNLDGDNMSSAFVQEICNSEAVDRLTQQVADAQSGMKTIRKQTAEGISEIAQQVTQTGEAMESLRRQTAEGFEQTVQKGGILSAINQSAEQVRIEAGKITLNGYATINDYFSVGTDGKMHARAGGDIAGFTITDGGLDSRYLQIDNSRGRINLGENKEYSFYWMGGRGLVIDAQNSDYGVTLVGPGTMITLGEDRIDLYGNVYVNGTKVH